MPASSGGIRRLLAGSCAARSHFPAGLRVSGGLRRRILRNASSWIRSRCTYRNRIVSYSKGEPVP
jgi:hypothetical protein